LRPEDIHAFIARYGRTGRAAAARVAAVSLRSFLHWLQLRGHVDTGLVAAVPTFRWWRHTALPRPLTDDQYRGLLATFDRTTPVGCRDYAIAACMGDLGLRCGEVADLTLDDLGGATGTLRVAAGKSRRGRVLPMPARVRQAVAAYVGRGRPASADRHLFLRHRTPAGVRVSRALVRGVIIRAFARVPGCECRTGTHVLRHTAATRLHHAGADVKRVADILGHRSIDTAAIYAKVDLARLSAVALPWPTAGEVRS
jgi:site-specific recombinase XerD